MHISPQKGRQSYMGLTNKVTHPIKFNAKKRKFEQLQVQLLKIHLIYLLAWLSQNKTTEKKNALD